MDNKFYENYLHLGVCYKIFHDDHKSLEKNEIGDLISDIGALLYEFTHRNTFNSVRKDIYNFFNDFHILHPDYASRSNAISNKIDKLLKDALYDILEDINDILADIHVVLVLESIYTLNIVPIISEKIRLGYDIDYDSFNYKNVSDCIFDFYLHMGNKFVEEMKIQAYHDNIIQASFISLISINVMDTVNPNYICTINL